MDTQVCVIVHKFSLRSSMLIIAEQQAFLSCTLTGDYNNNYTIMRNLDYRC